MKAITELGFEQPSEIQAAAIPYLIQGYNDLIGLAQTGTGKTAAFGLPLLERIDPSLPHTQALILAPTRELGQQIAGQMDLFSKYQGKVNVLAVYGGAPIGQQMRSLRKPQHIIIATPGRLIDLIQREAVSLENLQFLVLDEADEMLNMGFKQELDKILSYTPSDKLVWLFSATMSREIQRIVKKYMDDPVEVKLNTHQEVNVNIEHQFALVRQAHKTEALTRFLDVDPDIRGVVFCRTRRDTQSLADHLVKKNYRADALHGDLSQNQRDAVMKRFKMHDLQVLVATDIAARGIDVDDLTHVFHFSLPEDMAYYTHRSGRTARAGKQGTSLAFINGREKGKINQLTRELDISFTKVMVPAAEEIYANRIETWCHQILATKTRGRLDKQLLEKAELLFGNLSKEELIAKVLMHEMEKVNLDGAGDLNDTFEPRREKKGYTQSREGRNGYPKRNGNSFSGKKSRRSRPKKSGDRKNS